MNAIVKEIESEGIVVMDQTELNGKSLTLSYAAPSKGVSKGGWATVAPVDFKSAAGKVFYEVLTDQGVITFCHKPELKMEAGEIYTVSLSVEDFVQVATKAELVEGTYFDRGSQELR